MNQLLITNLNAYYGKKCALHDVNLELKNGLYGLIGPNGAGKTTLMKILTTMKRPDEGEVFWNGENIYKMGVAYRSLIGYVPQEDASYPFFTVEEFLNYIAALQNVKGAEAKKRIDEAMVKTECQSYRDQKLKSLSGGMRRRTMIASALIGNPSLLIMDEPSAGLDPYQREQLMRVIQTLAEERIVLYSTHIMSDLEWHARELILLKQGSVIAKGSRGEIIEGCKFDNTSWAADRNATLEDVYVYYFGTFE